MEEEIILKEEYYGILLGTWNRNIYRHSHWICVSSLDEGSQRGSEILIGEYND